MKSELVQEKKANANHGPVKRPALATSYRRTASVAAVAFPFGQFMRCGIISAVDTLGQTCLWVLLTKPRLPSLGRPLHCRLSNCFA